MKPKVRIRHWQKGYKRVAHCGATHGSFRTVSAKAFHDSRQAMYCRYGVRELIGSCGAEKPSAVSLAAYAVNRRNDLVANDGDHKLLAVALGINDRHVHAWESGRRNPGPKHLAKLAEVLGLEIADLLPRRDIGVTDCP